MVQFSSLSMDYMSLLLDLGELLILDDNGLDDEDLVRWVMSMGEPSFYSIHMIKDRGNSLFKDGNFSLAISLYKLALNFLCCLAIPPTHNQSEASSLAISLVLNLAACELKLSRYIEARCLCNQVLKFEPCNVKALYRRGSALKKLNFLAEALDDFEHASNLDPNNKDVARELSSISECLLLNPNGKRVAYHFDPLGRDKKGKKPLIIAEMDNKFVIPDVVSEASCSSSSSMELLENALCNEQSASSGSSDLLMDSSTISESCSPSPVEYDGKPSPSFTPETSKCSFSNKKQAHKKLYLSSKDYENLLLGRNLQFFHPKSGAYLKVRPLFTQTSTLAGIPRENPSREAVVPSFSSSPMNHFTVDIGPPNNLVNFHEEVDSHEVKRPRLSHDKISDHSREVCKVSFTDSIFLDQSDKVGPNPLPSQSEFVFSALKKHSITAGKRACTRVVGKSSCQDSLKHARTKVKNKSMLKVSRSSIFCRFMRTGALKMVAGFKRKEEGSIHFDYHPPFKKRRLCVLVNSVCNISYVSCVSTSLEGCNDPRFVL